MTNKEIQDIDKLVMHEINSGSVIDKYVSNEINRVLKEIKAEINYVGAHSDYGMQCVFAQAIAIIDKHMERIQNDKSRSNRNH